MNWKTLGESVGIVLGIIIGAFVVTVVDILCPITALSVWFRISISDATWIVILFWLVIGAVASTYYMKSQE